MFHYLNNIGKSTDALWTPADIVGFKRVWNPSEASTITESSGEVSILSEQFGAGNNLTSSTGKRPITGVRSQNGENLLDCEGIDFMEALSFPVPSTGDVSIMGFFIVDVVDSVNDSVYSMNASADFQLGAGNNSVFNGSLKTTNLGGSDITLTGGPFTVGIYNTNFDFNDSEVYNVYIDGIKRGADSTYTSKLGASQQFRVLTNRGGTISPEGAFGEIVVYENQTSDIREKLEGYLAHKYGITANLDVSHPYKSSPPTV